MSQTLRRAAATVVAALIATVASLSLASAAQAATFSGESEQGKNVNLQVRDNNGLPVRYAIRWNTSDCSGIESYRSNTIFRGFNRANEDSFRGRGVYPARDNNGYRSRVRVNVQGERTGKRRWAGSFSAKARIYRGSQQVGTCTLRDVAWTVKRGG